MIFDETTIFGCYLVKADIYKDERGSFARSWCRQEFERMGLAASIAQEGISKTNKSGTLRGLHYQNNYHNNEKLVRCTRGAIYDVIVDVRPESPTYLQWTGFYLNEGDHTLLYIPDRCAHGYQTLKDESEVVFSTGAIYAPDAVRGIRWDDPLFSITWPCPQPIVISERDRRYSDFKPADLDNRNRR